MSAIFIFVALGLPGASLNWWGNTVYQKSGLPRSCRRVRMLIACSSGLGWPRCVSARRASSGLWTLHMGRLGWSLNSFFLYISLGSKTAIHASVYNNSIPDHHQQLGPKYIKMYCI